MEYLTLLSFITFNAPKKNRAQFNFVVLKQGFTTKADEKAIGKNVWNDEHSQILNLFNY